MVLEVRDWLRWAANSVIVSFVLGDRDQLEGMAETLVEPETNCIGGYSRRSSAQ